MPQPDYENDLVFPPQEIKSQHELSEQGRQSEVLIKAIEKCEKLEKENQQLIKFLEEFNALDVAKENQQLKTQIAKLTEIVGVLPSNHSVGNLGYKIKNQRHEINNRLKEIDKLKELLKRCRDFINYEVPDHCIDDVLLDKIDNAIGEK